MASQGVVHASPVSSSSGWFRRRAPAGHAQLQQLGKCNAQRPARSRCIATGVAAADRPQLVVPTPEEHQRDDKFLKWLVARGVHQDKITTQPIDAGGYIIDTTVAAQDLKEGEVVLRVPEELIVTLNSVFEDDTVAEILTTGKLSELACLTLYMMYEKKEGKKSRWYEYIKELDKQRARGQQGAKSPLLWEPGEVERYLAGSPVQAEIRARLEGISKEYGELDTVWFMAGSLFRNYPYDTPTDAFPLKLFREAFAAVQASIVHLQGVPLSQRFALVPLGPPLLGRSATAKALLKYDPERKEVALVADRDYQKGDAIVAWCGPQPNSRLLLNYGVVEEGNPFDRLVVTATIPNSDPLFKAKRDVLQPAGLATQQAFDLKPSGGLPPLLLPYLRLAHAQTEEEVRTRGLLNPEAPASIGPANDREALHHLQQYLHMRLGRYPTTAEQDEAIIADLTSKPRKRVAARLIRIEKGILTGALRSLADVAGQDEAEPQMGEHSRLTSNIHIVKLA